MTNISCPKIQNLDQNDEIDEIFLSVRQELEKLKVDGETWIQNSMSVSDLGWIEIEVKLEDLFSNKQRPIFDYFYSLTFKLKNLLIFLAKKS